MVRLDQAFQEVGEASVKLSGQLLEDRQEASEPRIPARLRLSPRDEEVGGRLERLGNPAEKEGLRLVDSPLVLAEEGPSGADPGREVALAPAPQAQEPADAIAEPFLAADAERRTTASFMALKSSALSSISCTLRRVSSSRVRRSEARFSVPTSALWSRPMRYASRVRGHFPCRISATSSRLGAGTRAWAP